MEDLFRDKELQEKMDQEGVVTIPLLQEEELAGIREFYQELHPDGQVPQLRDGIHMTIWCSDRAYKERIREGIRDRVMPALNRHFQDFRIVSPVFIVKIPGAQTTFPIHQDWNVVDEERHRAFNVWIPLWDVDANTGSLWAVKGSHRLPTYIRGAGILFPKLYGLEDHIRPRMRSMDLQAGTGMVFYHRLVHGSPPNQGPNPRVVISFSVIPKAVPLHIYFQEKPDSKLQVYHPDDNFIYEFDNVPDDTERFAPRGELVAEHPPYRQIELTPALFDQYCVGKRPGFWQRLFGKS